VGFFWTSEIDKVNNSLHGWFFPLKSCKFGHLNCDDCVRSRRGRVHGSTPYRPVFVPQLDELVDLLVVSYSLFARSMHPDLSSVGFNFKRSSSLWRLNKQILDFLHINFDHLNGSLESNVGILVFSYSLEDLICSHGDDAWIATFAIGAGFSEKGIRFSWARLPIGESSTVQSFPSIFENFDTKKLPHLFLITVLATGIRISILVWLSDWKPVMRPKGVVERELTVRSFFN